MTDVWLAAVICSNLTYLTAMPAPEMRHQGVQAGVTPTYTMSDLTAPHVGHLCTGRLLQRQTDQNLRTTKLTCCLWWPEMIE